MNNNQSIEEIIAAWKNPEIRSSSILHPAGEVSDEDLETLVGGSDEITPQTTAPCGVIIRSVMRCPTLRAGCRTRGCPKK